MAGRQARTRRSYRRSPAIRTSRYRPASTSACPSGSRSWAPRSAKASYSATPTRTSKLRVTDSRRDTSRLLRPDEHRHEHLDVVGHDGFDVPRVAHEPHRAREGLGIRLGVVDDAVALTPRARD